MIDDVLDDDDLDRYEGDERIIKEAHQRFNAAVAWESTYNSNADADEKFFEGDAYNMYQWPDRLANSYGTGLDDKPRLTINRTAQHCLQIINDQKRNRPGINIRPTGGGATYKAAQTLQAIIEHIEYQSKAEQAYDWAFEKQVVRGVGYVTVEIEWAKESFEQNIRIKKILDPKSVYLDTNVKEMDGLDARWGFIFDDMDRSLFREQYPEYKRLAGLASPLGNTTMWGSWITPLKVRVAQYYRKLSTKDKLYVLTDDDGDPVEIVKASKIDKTVLREALGEMEAKGHRIRSRDITNDSVEWFKIAGEKIIDRKPWPGVFIPIVKMCAREIVVDGTMDRKGHVRVLLDPQRMYNFFSSSGVEYLTGQTKSPWQAAVEAIAGYETFYEQANNVNIPVLPYRSIAAGGQVLEMPKRVAPPMASEGYIQAMSLALQEFEYASGQYAANFGQPSNEKSGVAIDKRSQHGDNATYHWHNAEGVCIAGVGRVTVDLIPKVYDKARVLRIKGKDGQERNIIVDRTAPRPLATIPKTDEEDESIIFNPGMGEYAVQAEAGPGYATLRQEAFGALMQIVQGDKAMMMIFGDLLFRSADFPLADEMAERMKKAIDPSLTGDAPSPQQQEMMGQLTQLQEVIKQLQNEAEKNGLRMEALKTDRSHEAQRMDLDWYKALSERLEKLDNAVSQVATGDPNGLHALITEAINQAMADRPPPPQGGPVGGLNGLPAPQVPPEAILAAGGAPSPNGADVLQGAPLPPPVAPPPELEAVPQ